jgi:hypothetical protein
MKTIEDIKTRISTIISLKDNVADLNKKEIKKKRKKDTDELKRLRELIKYLETSPREEFIKSEIERIEKYNNRTLDMCKPQPLPNGKSYQPNKSAIKTERNYNENKRYLDNLLFLVGKD